MSQTLPSLHGESLEIKLTVPLVQVKKNYKKIKKQKYNLFFIFSLEK